MQLYKKIIKLPKTNILNKVINDFKQYLFFIDCIKTFNSMYLLITIKGGYKKQAFWHNKKGNLSQDILITVDFKMNFMYILIK